MLCKAVATLALPTFVIAVLTMPMFRERRIRTAVEFLLAAVAPVAVFQLWKLAVIGSVGGWATLMTNELLDVAGPNAPLSGSATVVAALSRSNRPPSEQRAQSQPPPCLVGWDTQSNRCADLVWGLAACAACDGRRGGDGSLRFPEKP